MHFPTTTGRFVVLFHSHPGEGDHFDLMIERGAALATWRVEAPPEACRERGALDCLRLADHRATYLEYEGPISGNRGEVSRHDAGRFEILDQSSGGFVIRLSGDRTVGVFVLEIVEGAASQWRLRLA
ncbi:MAG TPA: DNA polymerase ligase N-terminal domain-containing protein [Phycisphaerae bacterium]|nr:DNA polymerase ligase N-terminal domain-containing protein [Phycisphaerae bacterium]HRW53240.1 DNA polymerase ligase N-terminal domain-containing protein [Phycisphaerae bacterium]